MVVNEELNRESKEQFYASLPKLIVYLVVIFAIWLFAIVIFGPLGTGIFIAGIEAAAVVTWIANNRDIDSISTHRERDHRNSKCHWRTNSGTKQHSVGTRTEEYSASDKVHNICNYRCDHLYIFQGLDIIRIKFCDKSDCIRGSLDSNCHMGYLAVIPRGYGCLRGNW